MPLQLANSFSLKFLAAASPQAFFFGLKANKKARTPEQFYNVTDSNTFLLCDDHLSSPLDG